MAVLKQITVFLENVPGRLATLCNTLEERGVNLQAMTTSEASEYGVVRMIVDNVEAATDALRKVDLPFSTVDVLGVIKAVDGSAAIVATLEAMPLAPLVITVFTIMSIIFAATTYDSASYTLASSATLHLPAGDDPARWHRVFWAFALGVMPVTLLFVGGLDTIKVMLLITSTPILVVGVFMSYSLVKTLQHDVPA